MNLPPDNSKLIESIRQGGKQLEQAMQYMLHDSGLKESVGQFIQSNGGTKEDVDDIFQEGLKHLIINIRKKVFNQQSSIKTYLYGICKNLWYTKFTREVKRTKIQEQILVKEAAAPSPETSFILQEQQEELQKILALLGKNCKKVLGLWSLGFSFKEISQQTLRSEGAVRKQKFDCLKKLTSLFVQQPALIQVFKEKGRP